MNVSPDNSTALRQRPVKQLPVPEAFDGELRKPSTDRQLTRNQLKFINFYLAGKTPPEAARLAGYSESVAEVASQVLLRNPAIYREINQRARDKFKELEIDADWVLGQLGVVASANIYDYIEIDENGNHKVTLKGIDRYHATAIQELSYDILGRQKIKLKDSSAALEKIIRLMEFEKPKKLGGENKEPLTIQSLDAIVKKVTINQTTINQQINIQPQNRQLSSETKVIESSS